jgi:hypothetical protein
LNCGAFAAAGRQVPVDALMCGNGSLATPHPSELFGEDWMHWGVDARKPGQASEPAPSDIPK